MANNVGSSVGPPDVLDSLYESLNILRKRNDKTMDVLVVLREEHKLLKKETANLGGEVGTLKNSNLLQDRRITTLEAGMEMVRARSITKKQQIRVSCPMCGKDLAKGSLRYHMNIACRNRPIRVLTE